MMISNAKHGFGENVNGYYDVGRQLPDYLLHMAKEYIREEKEQKEKLISIEQFEKRRETLRQAFIEAIGGLPTEKTPLNPVVTGARDCGKYQVKNVIFESLPKMYVTANLYVPHGLDKPVPAILMACGHADNGKAAETYQKAAMDLADNGMVVLVVDPVGQGERLQYDKWDEEGNYLVGRTTREHTYMGQQCVLTGSSLARYMIWDLIRAVDYLESLDEVDNTRIGMTGNSGGGTQTSYMMLCEKRLAAAMPCCFISSRMDYMKTGQVQDLEQIIYNIIKAGINHDDFITALAPKPVRIGVARYDFFCPEGADKTLEAAKKIYALYGGNVDVSVSYANATHGFSKELREGAVNFFRRTLLGLEEDYTEDPKRTALEENLLWATKTGRIIDQCPDIKTIWDYNLERLEQIRYTDTDDKAELKERILKVLQIPADLSERFPIKYPRIIEDFVDGDVRIRKLFFFTEEDIVCTGVLFEKTDKDNSRCTIYVSDDTTAELEKNQEDIERLLADGSVFAFDPRGIGNAKSRIVYPPTNGSKMGRMFDNYYKLNCDSQMMGTSLYAQRVYDIIRARDLMKDFFKFEKVVFAGRNYGAVDILTAGCLEEDIDVALFGEPISFEEIVRNKYYHTDPRNNIHGLLKAYDVSLLIKVLKAVLL